MIYTFDTENSITMRKTIPPKILNRMKSILTKERWNYDRNNIPSDLVTFIGEEAEDEEIVHIGKNYSSLAILLEKIEISPLSSYTIYSIPKISDKHPMLVLSKYIVIKTDREDLFLNQKVS